MQLIITGVPRRDRLLNTLAKCCGGTIKQSWDGLSTPVIVGNDKGMDDIQRHCHKDKKPYLYFDHAYFTRHPEMHRFRLCVSSYHCNDWRDSTRKANCKVKDWKKDGSTIVVIKPSNTVGRIYPVSEWFDETMATLKEHTDRKIIVKKKGEGALNDVLTNAFAAVCYGSVADVDTVRLGIPVFCGSISPSSFVAQHDLRLIETPSYPDRAQWLRSLAASEWGLDEMSQAWERVKPLCQLPPTQN